MSDEALITLGVVGIVIGLIVIIFALVKKRFWKLIGVIFYDIYGIAQRFLSQKTGSIIIAVLQIISAQGLGVILVLDFITVLFTGRVIGGPKKNMYDEDDENFDSDIEERPNTLIEDNKSTETVNANNV